MAATAHPGACRGRAFLNECGADKGFSGRHVVETSLDTTPRHVFPSTCPARLLENVMVGDDIPMMTQAEWEELRDGKVEGVEYTLSREGWRYFFTGLAMQSVIFGIEGTTEDDCVASATLAVKHADAALAELKRTKAKDEPTPEDDNDQSTP